MSMNLTKEQVNALNQPIDKANVSERWADKRKTLKLAYIESWHVIREANRIFDYDWSSETIRMDLVHADNFCVTYIAKVRVIVNGIIKEGIGAGHGRGERVPAGDKHESAVKEAESDARKRALMQFGDQFGLSLYDKDKNWQKATPPVNNSVSSTNAPTQKQEEQLKSVVMPKALTKQERELVITTLTQFKKDQPDKFKSFAFAFKANYHIPQNVENFSDYIQEPKHAEWIEMFLRSLGQ